MKILVTGSSGFVGTHLISLLGKKNEIVKFDIKEGKDIRNLKMLEKSTKGVGVVIHLAALIVSTESWDRPIDYFETNGIGTLNVILASIKNKVKRVVVISSAATYGNPINPYGASKKWAEAVCETYRDIIEIAVVRPFNIYGKGQNPAYGYVIHNFASDITKGNPVTIYGDGKQTRDFINVEDVVKVISRLAKIRKVPPTPFDLGTGKEITIKDLALLEAGILKKKLKIRYSTKRQEPHKSVANVKTLRDMGIDVSKFTNLKSGLTKLLFK